LTGGFWWCEEASIFERKRSIIAPPLPDFRKYWGGFRPLNFSSEALDYVSRVDTKIVLIDGETLAELMIDHNVGVSTIATYDLKKIDSDYFTEE